MQKICLIINYPLSIGSIPKLLSCPLLIIVDLMNFSPSPRLPVKLQELSFLQK
ncbi:hypothetical protein CWATWH8502_1954 [Crocosphaera watsonii WH 8502]|uniref:Uncharacterized protein n=2 Tax=Crocosphaera watsonii TaxID=263511 RepID=T2IW98_CROWT|nr:hypothetical protein CWATWH8502_1954 [Crocosphaera watsonii WH 8502]CCQ57936.1 hypothetical protein CWATWH0005_1945 [Crocosphaera watsonii WH 0005]